MTFTATTATTTCQRRFDCAALYSIP